MSKSRRVGLLVLLSAGVLGALSLGGCGHYRITDTLTGKKYYADGISMRTRQATGAVYFQDVQTGRQTVVLVPEIEKISGQEYKAALRARAGVEEGVEGY